MDINKELFEKYFDGNCTKSEIIKVEAWLQTGNYIESLNLSAEVLAGYKQEARENIAHAIQAPVAKMGTYHQVLKRYAVAACFLFSVIGAWHHSGGLYTENRLDRYASHLHIVSGDNLITSIEGDHFDIKFDGLIALYNASASQTTIVCGIKTFELEPQKGYSLKGNQLDCILIHANQSIEYPLSNMLKGDFSVHQSNI